LLFNSAVLLLALGAGIALAILLEQMNPAFTRRGQLAATTGLKVLGAVTRIEFGPPVGLLRRQPVLAGGAVAALIMLFVIGFALTDWASRSANFVVH
jgi:hypothetical protein